MGLAQFRTTDEEEIEIARRMAISGDKTRSDHFRRAYFQSAGDYEQVVGEVRSELERQDAKLEDMRKLIYRIAEQRNDGLELRLLCGLFSLIYPSVDEKVRSTVSKHLDVQTIEQFLTGTTARKPR